MCCTSSVILWVDVPAFYFTSISATDNYICAETKQKWSCVPIITSSWHIHASVHPSQLIQYVRWPGPDIAHGDKTPTQWWANVTWRRPIIEPGSCPGRERQRMTADGFADHCRLLLIGVLGHLVSEWHTRLPPPGELLGDPYFTFCIHTYIHTLIYYISVTD